MDLATPVPYPDEPTVIPLHLGRTDLAAVVAEAVDASRTREGQVTVDVVGFDYFDADALDRLADLSETTGGRVRVRGLDGYAAALAGPVAELFEDDRVRRAVSVLHPVALVHRVVDDRLLTTTELGAALRCARESGSPVVTVDLAGTPELSSSELLLLAEVSAELTRDARELLLLNAGRVAARQVRTAGLSGGLHLSLDRTA